MADIEMLLSILLIDFFCLCLFVYLTFLASASLINMYVGAIGGGERFNDGAENTLLGSVVCYGNENQLTDCAHNESVSCGRLQDAHAVCQGMLIHVFK